MRQVQKLFRVQVLVLQRTRHLIGHDVIEILGAARHQKLLVQDLHGSRTQCHQPRGPFALPGVPVPLHEDLYVLGADVPRQSDVIVLERSDVVEAVDGVLYALAPVHAAHDVSYEVGMVGRPGGEDVDLDDFGVEVTEHVVGEVEHGLGVEAAGDEADFDGVESVDQVVGFGDSLLFPLVFLDELGVHFGDVVGQVDRFGRDGAVVFGAGAELVHARHGLGGVSFEDGIFVG
mmetsp:Transcript_521/g.1068  ORF Transcript_521/g.1068 Transcript_521/m.1068 type:complete len:232 (-) Transcript_521:1354-2049(-)